MVPLSWAGQQLVLLFILIMIRFVLLGMGVTLLILGAGYLVWYIGRIKGSGQTTIPDKKGLLAAIGAILIGALLIFRNKDK